MMAITNDIINNHDNDVKVLTLRIDAHREQCREAPLNSPAHYRLGSVPPNGRRFDQLSGYHSLSAWSRSDMER